MEAVIADARQLDLPPVDSLAEQIVLNRMLFRPWLISRYDVGQLLVFKDHQFCWRTLSRARMRCETEDAGEFLQIWLAEVERLKPGQQMAYLNLLWSEEIRHGETARAFAERAHLAEQDPEGSHPLYRCYHDMDWWVARLRAVADARRIIRAAQEIAERAWRAPGRPFTNQDAHAVLRRLCPVRESDIVMEVPV